MTAKITTLNADEVIRLYLEGVSEKGVAERYHVSRPVIRRLLLRHNIVPRSQSQAEIVKWSHMTDEQRRRQVQAAHDTVRGKPQPIERIERSAKTRQQKQLGISRLEDLVRTMLNERGIEIVPQQAIGPYNCDLGAFPVAVECFGGYWHFTGRHSRREPKRLDYLLNAGWHVLYILINRRYPLLPAVADYIAAFYQLASGNPTMPRQYGMVGGTGEVFFLRSAEHDHLPIIPPFTSGRNPTTGQYERVPRDTVGMGRGK